MLCVAPVLDPTTAFDPIRVPSMGDTPDRQGPPSDNATLSLGTRVPPKVEPSVLAALLQKKERLLASPSALNLPAVE